MAESSKADSSESLAHDVLEKIKPYKRLIISVVVIAAVLLVSYSVVLQQRKHSTSAVNAALFQADYDIKTKAGSDAAGIFAKIAVEYAGTPGAFQALVKEFAAQFDKGDFAAAEKTAKTFVANYPGHPFLPRMRLALAQTLMSQGKYDEAEKEVAILRGPGGSPDVEGEVRLAQAQIYEKQAELAKDNPDRYKSLLGQAQDMYNDIVSRGQRQFWPASIVGNAELALVLVRDRLAGYVAKTPEEAELDKALNPDVGGEAAVEKAPAEVVAEPTEKPVEEVKAPAEAKVEPTEKPAEEVKTAEEVKAPATESATAPEAKEETAK